MANKVLVTPRSVTRGGHHSLDKLRAKGYEVIFCKAGVQPTEEELRALLPGCIGFLAGVEPITADVLEAATSLRVISRNGTGVDNVDLDAAERLGITVLRAEGANARGVAELTIGLLFSLSRSVNSCDAALKRGAWERGKPGLELEGRTLGLAGCGRVGKLTASMALGIGMKVKAFDPYPDPSFAPGSGFRYSSLDDVIATSDVISLHCPPASDGRPVLDAAALSRVKRGAFVINTARHDVIDAGAMLAALDDEQVGGLAIDVFETEPPVDFSLARHPRVIATPHIGGFTRESIDRAMTVAVNNLIEALQSSRNELTHSHERVASI